MQGVTPTVILFDLDDTILRYSAPGNEAWDEVCKEFAPCFAEISEPDLLNAVRTAAHWYWSDRERHRQGRLDLRAARRTVVRMALESLGCEVSAAADDLADAFTDRREQRVTPFDRAKETLQVLCSRGIRLGLLTNGHADFQRRKIERFGLAGFFEVILIESELGFGKPDERVFRRALSALAVVPSQTWMIGDNLEWDIAPAQALGIHDIWVDHARAGLPTDAPVQPTRTVAAIEELVSFLGEAVASNPDRAESA